MQMLQYACSCTHSPITQINKIKKEHACDLSIEETEAGESWVQAILTYMVKTLS